MSASEAPKQDEPTGHGPARVRSPGPRSRLSPPPPPAGRAGAPPEPGAGGASAVAAARAHRVVDRLLGGLTPSAAAQAASAETDLDVLAELLRVVPYAPSVADPRVAAAYARGRAAKEALLEAEGGMVGSKELSELRGLSRQTIDKRRKAGKLLGVLEGGVWLYPVWQFGADGECLPGLDRVLKALQEQAHGPWAPVLLLLEGETASGESPLEALRAGRIDAAVQAARVYGTHGAK